MRDLRKGGETRKYADRLVLDLVFYVLRSGCQWRMRPRDQSAYNKRLNAAGPLISHVIEALARQVPTWNDDLRLIDSRPCGPVRCVADRWRGPPFTSRPDRIGV